MNAHPNAQNVRAGRRLLAVAAAAVPLILAAVAAAEEKTWYRSPSLSVMTGYIYEPKSRHTMEQWLDNLGDKMDAEKWVADFKAAGASYLIFYDKWIDGLVFHDTQTTGYKTKRDFLKQVAAACQRGGLKLVLYFNAVSDGNPEFDKWATRDRRGRPIVFGARWPTRYQTLHSPFRKISVQQVQELLTGYGRIDGLWLDIFGERLNTNSTWVAQGYRKMFGQDFAKASGAQLAELNARTLAGYLDEVRALAARHQPHLVWTSNGSAPQTAAGGVWRKWVSPRLDYLSVEGHSLARNEQLARLAWTLDKPIEIGLLLNRSWFTPMTDAAPPANMTPRQAIAATAVAVCQGASVYFALTPGHGGVFGGDLKVAQAVGAWFRTVEPILRDARPAAEAGILLGSAPADGNILALRAALARAGVVARPSPGAAGHSAVILPQSARLDDAQAERLRQYVRQGGRLIALGKAALPDVLGVRYKGVAAVDGRPGKTVVKADSEYDSEYRAAHLVDGLPTAWASGGAPMPHWAEIILPEPIDVARIELVSRQGPYHVTDVDFEADVAGSWKLIKKIRNAPKRVISVTADAPVRTGRIRVRILKELYQGKDRQYADVEAVRIFDKTGRDRSTNPAGVPLKAVAKELADIRAGFPPTVVRVEPTTAQVLAKLDAPGQWPAVLRNRFGKGEALLIAADESSLANHPAFWTALSKLAFAAPAVHCPDPARYLTVLTRLPDGHALHVIDRHAAVATSKPGTVRVTLAAKRLGITQAKAVSGQLLKTTVGANGEMTLDLQPDPVVSVVLR